MRDLSAVVVGGGRRVELEGRHGFGTSQTQSELGWRRGHFETGVLAERHFGVVLATTRVEVPPRKPKFVFRPRHPELCCIIVKMMHQARR